MYGNANPTSQLVLVLLYTLVRLAEAFLGISFFVALHGYVPEITRRFSSLLSCRFCSFLSKSNFGSTGGNWGGHGSKKVLDEPLSLAI